MAINGRDERAGSERTERRGVTAQEQTPTTRLFLISSKFLPIRFRRLSKNSGPSLRSSVAFERQLLRRRTHISLGQLDQCCFFTVFIDVHAAHRFFFSVSRIRTSSSVNPGQRAGPALPDAGTET
ncbi:hypothetical protein N8I77_000580 [Diaporthe amygdali]|uniref:Uncharacterized protein n=1 Tax=Phomopsis amygdali TaxID=1214568 RepID=A0AAD9SQA1_PHOAM|nr:hypothetical protein N8I77_000580 [Diaporthe amygdali]